jgi:hypothetical protein
LGAPVRQKRKGGIPDAAFAVCRPDPQAVACTSVPGGATCGLAKLDCASRFWMSACRKACSEADEPPLEGSVDVELPVVLPAVVDPVVLDPAVLDPVVVDVEPVLVALPLAVEPVAVDVEPVPVVLLPAVAPVAVVDVEASLPEPAGFNALTSAWKSCCSFDNALSPELDEDPDELVRLCSRF